MTEAAIVLTGHQAAAINSLLEQDEIGIYWPKEIGGPVTVWAGRRRVEIPPRPPAQELELQLERRGTSAMARDLAASRRTPELERDG